MATGNKFCIDIDKNYLNDGGDLRVIFFEEDSLYSEFFVCAVLNSRVCEYYHLHHTKLKRDGYYEYFEGQLSVFPIPSISFTTDAEKRTSQKETGKSLYADSGYVDAASWITTELSLGCTTAAHDLLAYLAEQMITMHQEKQTLTTDFWTDLEGVAAPAAFRKLRDKGKQEAGLWAEAALRPFVRQTSKSTRTLDDSLAWDEAAFKAFVRALAGPVDKLSDLLKVYGRYAPRYRDLTDRLARTDRLIDQIVYRLYGLTEEEIAIVEGRGGKQ